MKKPYCAIVSSKSIFAGFLMFLASAAFGQTIESPTKTPAPPFTCTNESLTGKFATRGSGFTPANPMDPTSPLAPFANVSSMTFDGEGGLTNAAVNSANGTIIPANAAGTYDLNPDCTGSMTISAPVGVLTFYLVVSDRGKGFYMISTVPRSVVTVEGNRLQ